MEWHQLHTHCTNLPSQQLCSVPRRRCPHTGTMNALQLKPIVRTRLCLLPASQAKARCSTWQSLLRAATAQHALCTHTKHTHSAHTTHTHSHARRSKQLTTFLQCLHRALPAQRKRGLTAACNKVQEQPKFPELWHFPSSPSLLSSWRCTGPHPAAPRRAASLLALGAAAVPPGSVCRRGLSYQRGQECCLQLRQPRRSHREASLSSLDLSELQSPRLRFLVPGEFSPLWENAAAARGWMRAQMFGRWNSTSYCVSPSFTPKPPSLM